MVIVIMWYSFSFKLIFEEISFVNVIVIVTIIIIILYNNYNISQPFTDDNNRHHHQQQAQRQLLDYDNKFNPRKRGSSKDSDTEPTNDSDTINSNNKDDALATFAPGVAATKTKEHRRKSVNDKEKRRRLESSIDYDDIGYKGEVDDVDDTSFMRVNDDAEANADDEDTEDPGSDKVHNSRKQSTGGDSKNKINDNDVICDVSAGKATPTQTEIKLQRPLGLLAQHGLSIKSGSSNHNRSATTNPSTTTSSGRVASEASPPFSQPHHALGHAPPLPPGAFYPGCFVFPPFQPPPHSSFPQAAFGHPVNPHHHHPHPHQQLAQAVAAFQRQQPHFADPEDKSSSYHQLHQSGYTAKNLAIKSSRSPVSPGDVGDDKTATRSDNEYSDVVDGKRSKKKRRQGSLSPSNQDKFDPFQGSRNSSPLNDSTRRRKSEGGGATNDDEEDDDEIEVDSADNYFGDYRYRPQPPYVYPTTGSNNSAVNNDNNRNNDYPFSVGTPGSDSNHGNFSLMDRRFMPSPPPAPVVQNGTPSKQEFSANGSGNGSVLAGAGGKSSPNSGGSSGHHWTFEEQFKQVCWLFGSFVCYFSSLEVGVTPRTIFVSLFIC